VDWLQVWGPSIVAVIVATALSGLLGKWTEHQRRQGVCALLSSEILHNTTALIVLQGNLDRLAAQFDDPRVALAVFRSTAKSPQWQTMRWCLPEVGVAVQMAVLLRLTEWYNDLDQMTFLYDHLVGVVMRLDLRQRDEKMNRAAQADVQEMKRLAELADNLVRNTPPLPDTRFEGDPGVKQYVKDLVDRQTRQTTPATDEHDDGA
jgi:hypothetical protein